MPELAEIETVKRYLEKNILEHKITSFNSYCNSLRYPLAKDIKEIILEVKIVKIRRRAKYLLLDLSNQYTIIVHLGMSGRFFLHSIEYEKHKHDHIIMGLSSDLLLILNDTRRFGMFYCIPTNQVPTQSFIKNLGVEPLEDNFNVDYLKNKMQGKNLSVKSFLMSNAIVVGVGNIYSSESLFTAKIHPRRPSFSISDKEMVALVEAIKLVLQKAIEAGGTTLRDFVGGNREPGHFKQELLVYGRENMPCVQCETPIETIKQSGRTTFFCPMCQV